MKPEEIQAEERRYDFGVGDVIEDRTGTLYKVSEIYGLWVSGYKLKSNGTPGVRVLRVWREPFRVISRGQPA